MSDEKANTQPESPGDPQSANQTTPSDPPQSVDPPVTDSQAADSQAAIKDPGISSVYDYLLYGVSLPERTLRSTSAMIGGVLRESTELLVPQAFRSSKSYEIFVKQAIDLMAENIGGVEAEPDAKPSATQVEGYVARKAVGNFMELAGFATLHVSPITVLAVLSDVAYGSKTYLHELSQELKREGIIAEDSTIDSATDLLDAVSNASGVTAEAFDMPPLSVDGLRDTINQTKNAVTKINPTRILPQSEISRLWNEMNDVASKEDVGLFEVSSAMTLFSLNQVTTVGKGALSTVRVAGNLFDRHFIDHYFEGIDDIRKKGIYASLAESSQPYMRAVWFNFSSSRGTVTEEIFTGRIFGRALGGMARWFSSEANEAAKDVDGQASSQAQDGSDSPIPSDYQDEVGEVLENDPLNSGPREDT